MEKEKTLEGEKQVSDVDEKNNVASAGWEGKAGDTLLIPSGPSGSHLFVVLFDPQLPRDQSLRKKLHLAHVNFSSIRDGMNYDATCIINSGEHRFIKQQSYVNYQCFRHEEYEPIKRAVDNGRVSLHDPVTYDLLNRIRLGALSSTKTPPHIRYEIVDLMALFRVDQTA